MSPHDSAAPRSSDSGAAEHPELTERAALRFAALARALQARGHDPLRVARFLHRLLICLFAADAGLLPPGRVTRLVDGGLRDPDTFAAELRALLGRVAPSDLFGDDDLLPLTPDDLAELRAAAHLDWSRIEPAIFGTLFERALDPARRAQLGAHYTDRAAILALVEPVVLAPLRREFEATQREVVRRLGDPAAAASLRAFLARLRRVTVLDPACGAGNFLYVALQALQDLELDVIRWGARTLQIAPETPELGPEALRGLEKSPHAAELAQVAIWLGELQWSRRAGVPRDPTFRPRADIRCVDALLEPSDPPLETRWPPSEFIVGNPPFLGGKLLRGALGDAYVDRLFALYRGRVAAESDLVCYWFEKARAMVERGEAARVGLLATQAIRGGANRRTLARIKETGDIFLAWSDRAWVVEGAEVHVSLVGFDDGAELRRTRDGVPVPAIHADLRAGPDLTRAPRLAENLGLAFMGDTKGGPFELSAAAAAALLARRNPSGRSNRDVVVPWLNGASVTRAPRDLWIVDFGVDLPEADAAAYEAPFAHVRDHVRPRRAGNRRCAYAERWWLHAETRAGMRRALAGLPRFIGTVRHAKHRLFFWIPAGTLPDSALIVFARGDDYTFGVLHSRAHALWARATGTQVRERQTGLRYTPTTTFETFPFPRPSDAQREEIAAAARALDLARRDALAPGRPLTVLYTEAPPWLVVLVMAAATKSWECRKLKRNTISLPHSRLSTSLL